MFNLTKLKSLVMDFSIQAKKLRSEIETKKQRREYLATAPLPRSDIADALCGVLERQMNDPKLGYPRRLSQMLEFVKNKPLYDFNASNLAIINTRGLASDQSIPTPNLICFFGDMLTKRLRDAVAQISWPDKEAGPALAERLPEIEKLDIEIDKLESKETALIQEAKQAGIRIDF